ncbi:MAG: phage integrase SAM-like domain-containing protein, partial [Anaerolineaceae bacterium]|nr:phage integrase SAM-like domain-containing protein [Anaerolineaceae bacterium]
MGRNRKEYAITQAGCDVVDINEYRKAPWVQTWGIHTHDFRRWLYIGRPNLNEHKHGKGLVHAGRDNLVAALRDAVWKAVVRDTTKQFYSANGLAIFFEFLDARHKIHPVTSLEQIDKVLLEEFIYWLRHIKQANTETGRLAYNGARKGYTAFKSVLLHLVQQKALPRDIFPVNPFPNSNRASNNHAPYSKQVMRELLKALSQDIQELRSGKLKLSPSETLTVYLLVIAARSGRNPTPLLEATRDALQPHPIKPQQMALLQLYKNRGSTSHLQGYRFQRKFEDIVSVPMDVITL